MRQPHYQPRSSQAQAGGADFLLPESTYALAAEQSYNRGNQFYNNYLARSLKRDLEQAIVQYQQAVELNPTYAEALVKLASCLWDSGEISSADALQRCEYACRLKPNCAEAALFMGYFARREGQLYVAEKAFQTVLSLKSDIGVARARLALGRLYIQQAVVPQSGSPLLRLAKSLHGLSLFAGGLCALPSDTQAFQVIQKAAVADAQILAVTSLGKLFKMCRMPNMSARLYEWASQQMEAEPIFFHLLGDLQSAQGNHSEAIYYYHRGQELNPDDLVLHKKLGYAYSHCEDPGNAAKSLEKLVEANVDDFEALYTLAQSYTDNQQYLRALYYYKELLRKQPNNAYLHGHFAFVLFKLEDYDGAIDAYNEAVQLGRDPVWTATVAQTLGTIYYQIKHDTEAALQMFQLATHLDSKNLEAWAMLGDMMTEQGSYEAAIPVYKHILNTQPDNADCYNYLGYLLWQLDKNDEAIVAYQRSIDLDGENPIAYNNLGVIFLDEKCQLHKALGMFEQAYRIKPDYTLACFNIGRTKEALGYTTEAARCYSDALSLNTTNPELGSEEIQERLEQLFAV